MMTVQLNIGADSWVYEPLPEDLYQDTRGLGTGGFRYTHVGQRAALTQAYSNAIVQLDGLQVRQQTYKGSGSDVHAKTSILPACIYTTLVKLEQKLALMVNIIYF